MNPNTVKAIVRSLTPWATSVVAAVIAHFGYHVSNTVALQIVVAVGSGLTLLWHALERKFPWVGAFLGWVGAPAYAPSNKQVIAQLQAQVAALTAKSAEAVSPSPTTAPQTTEP